MAEDLRAEESIFLEAIGLASTSERQAYLERTCGSDTKLFDEVTALLRAHEIGGDLLELPDRNRGSERSAVDYAPGTVIGNYRLSERIGAGGMGVVYAAEQEQPLKRKVALKIIRPGMNTEEVIGRFETERQALALMDHPNIATVLDAGTCASGLPYFVMELVRGIALTDYCARQESTIGERLALFVKVCLAVQHAHQKGVIHRDLKPTNVLISLRDGLPVVKVIDFGVAKAVNQQLTDRDVNTRCQQMVGTPLYMSPEQAELGGLLVDTRADVYSLGVLLYELLTGTTPFDRHRLEHASPDEARRIICREDPPRPSTRLNTCVHGGQRSSRFQGPDTGRRQEPIRSDLDWIVMKAMEKDRSRRYDSASSLARDLTRYLAHEVVEARPPSTGYRLAKYYERNRVFVTAAGCVAAVLLVGFVLSIAAFRRTASLNTQLQTTLTRLTQSIYDQGVADALSGEREQAEDLARQLHELGDVEQALQLRAFSMIVSERWEDAIASLVPAVEQNSKSVALVALLTSAYGGSGDLKDWFRYNQRLRTLVAESDSERLLKAIAISPLDPGEAKAILDETVRSHRSPVALLMRGRALATYAQHTGRSEYLAESLADVTQARAWLATEGIAGWMALETYLRAETLAASTGELADLQPRLEDAASVVAALESQLERSVWESIWLGKYYYERGDRRRTLQHYEQAALATRSDVAVQHYLCLAYELDIAPSEEFIERRDLPPLGPYSELACGFILAAEGRRGEAARRVRRLIDSHVSLDAALTGLLLLHYTGDFSAARRFAQQLQNHWRQENLDPWHAWLRDSALPYYLADVDDDSAAALLLQRARESEYPKRWLAIAHSQIAATHAGRNQDDKAKHQMQLCVDQRQLDTFDSRWWRAVMSRN